MTQRKPPGVRWETWIDQQIREAAERGEFADLPGHGRPIAGMGSTDHEDWWLREKLRREEIAVLPPSLRLRKEVLEATGNALAAPTEETARGVVEAVNVKIRKANRLMIEGPPVALVPFDVDEVAARWRAAHAPDPAPSAPPPEAGGTEPVARRRRPRRRPD